MILIHDTSSEQTKVEVWTYNMSKKFTINDAHILRPDDGNNYQVVNQDDELIALFPVDETVIILKTSQNVGLINQHSD